MSGKTHLAVGIAVALALEKPDTLPELLVGTGAAALGSLISDIDVGTSNSHKTANKITFFSVLMIIAAVLLESIFQLGIFENLMSDSNLKRIVLGCLIFIVICAIGKEQPHRAFMHSLLALVVLSACVELVFSMAMPYFALAFLSHILLDTLNLKKVRLWYPISGGFCLGWCKSDGIANMLFLLIGTIGASLQIVWTLLGILAIV